MFPLTLKAWSENRVAWRKGVSRHFVQSSNAFCSVVRLTQSGAGNQTYSTTLSSHSRHCETTLKNTHFHTECQSYYKYTHNYSTNNYCQSHRSHSQSFFSPHSPTHTLTHTHTHWLTYPRQQHRDLSLSFTCTGQ